MIPVIQQTTSGSTFNFSDSESGVNESSFMVTRLEYGGSTVSSPETRTVNTWGDISYYGRVLTVNYHRANWDFLKHTAKVIVEISDNAGNVYTSDKLTMRNAFTEYKRQCQYVDT